jgi:hypothetical protein
MLTPQQSDIAMLSLFYWGLSVLMLRIVITVDFTRSFHPFHKHVSTLLGVNQAVKL